MPWACRDHNATSYSTETDRVWRCGVSRRAEIITLRAIALKHRRRSRQSFWLQAEIITLRAIALKQFPSTRMLFHIISRDHNATSYSTETWHSDVRAGTQRAEIITLRAIALKRLHDSQKKRVTHSRDHNATSYSTETFTPSLVWSIISGRDHNATSYSTETSCIESFRNCRSLQRS